MKKNNLIDPYGIEDTINVITRIYGMNAARLQKTRVLYDLASQVGSGDIVELGAYLGCGTIALCYGVLWANSRAIVNTVDLYEDMTGWAGELYTNSEAEFWKNIDEAGVNPELHVGSFAEIANDFDETVAMLFWDGGVTDIVADIKAWEKNVLPGGIIVVKDTPNKVLGSDRLAEYLARLGSYEAPEQRGYGGYMTSFKKKGKL
jgi:predicted O-methyltransferase YrrM